MTFKTEIDQVKLEKIADCDHEVFALIKQRYSPRVFARERITDTELNQLFEAARWAASSNNMQPWRFIYTKKGSEQHQKMVDCLSEFNQKWAKNAPILLLTAYKKQTPDGKDNFHALHDLGQAVSQMAIQGQYLNIGLHQMAGVDWQKATKAFNVPESYHVTTAIALGYYGGNEEELPTSLKEQELQARTRIPISEFVHPETWTAS